MNARYVDIGKIAHVIGQDACEALPGLHAFTGCDSVSAFARIGKVKLLKKLLATANINALSTEQLGKTWLMSEDLLIPLAEFVCDMYGAKKDTSGVNQCRYVVFCAKKANNDELSVFKSIVMY